MKLLSVFLSLRLLSVVGVLGVVLVSPVGAEVVGGNSRSPLLDAETQRGREGVREKTPLQLGTAADLVAQGITRVTGVEVIQTEDGLELVLETVAGSERLVPLILPEGNDLVIDILDATLAFNLRNGVEELNPAEGITKITVNKIDESSIRVRITGETQAPSAEVVPGRNNLVLSVTSERATAQPAPDEEIEVIATGEGEEGYNVENSSTVTRTDTPLKDTPQSVQVIPQEVLEDQNADLSSALLNVPSVRNTAPSSFGGLRIQVRGFFSSPTLNGFKDSLSSSLGPDLTGIERIEVLQGPNSILFGSSSPGGTINFVTKQPRRDPYYFAEVTIGNFDFYRGEVDLSGPLDKSRKVLYRLNASYRDQGFFIDFSKTRSLVIAPAISIELGKNTKLTLEGTYKDIEFEAITYGLPVNGTIESNLNGEIPRDRNVNEGIFHAEGPRIGYTLEHKFNENWSLRNAFLYSRYYGAYEEPDGGTFPDELLPDNRTLERTYFVEAYDQRDYRMLTNVIGKFATGSIEHQLLFGFDLGRQTVDSSGQSREIAPLDLFDPIYGQPPGAIIPGSEYDTNTLTDELGLIAQDRLTITDNLTLLVGSRLDFFEQTDEDLITDTETSQSGNAFSPRVGILYKPIEPVSLYANYSRSFEPSIGQSFDGEEFKPTRGTQFEVGVKADLNNRLSSTLALYTITQSNVTTEDPDNISFSVQTGEQRSRGIELSLAGDILPGWNVFASYAYNDAEVTEDNVIAVGNRVARTTPHAASLWTTYEIQQGDLEGLGFGLGLFYVGDRAGDADNTFEVPDYLTIDAVIF
jgi:iron complex outermembrane receptor protein